MVLVYDMVHFLCLHMYLLVNVVDLVSMLILMSIDCILHKGHRFLYTRQLFT